MKNIWILITLLQLLIGYHHFNTNLTGAPMAQPALTEGQEEEIQTDSSLEENLLTFKYALDSGYSWKVTSAGSGMFSADNSLYGSNDRGRSWHKLSDSLNGSLPGGPIGDLRFQSQDIGWITIHSPRQGVIELYKTTDGGMEWAKEKLEIPSKYAAAMFNPAAPVFFPSTDYGMIILNDVELQNAAGQAEASFLFYATQDSGRHWTPLMDQPKGTWNGLSWEASTRQNSAIYQWKISLDGRTWTSSDGVLWKEH